MSGAQTSTSMPLNELYNMVTGATGLSLQSSQNELMKQQQDISGHQIEMGARLASTLLDPTVYPTTEARAAAYPGLVARARAQFPGYFTNAPDTYPGDAATQALARLGTPSTTQQEWQANIQANKAISAANTPAAATATDGAGGTGTVGGADTAPINAAGDSRTRKAGEGGPPAPGSPGAAVAQQVHDFWISKGFSEPVVAGIMAGGPGSESNFIPTASGDGGTSIGLYQHHGPRLHNAQGTGLFDRYGPNPTADQQNQYAAWEISPQGPLANVGEMLKTAKTAAEGAAIWTQYFGVPADKTEIGRRAAGAQRFVGLYGQPGAPGSPQAPPGVTMGQVGDRTVPPPPGGVPGPYTGGGMGAVLAPGGPGGRRLTQAERLGGTDVAGPPMVASTNPTAATPTTDQMATPARYAGTTPAPSAEAPPETGWGTQVGSGYGPQNALAPAPVPPAPVPPAPAPPARPVATAPAPSAPSAPAGGPQPPHLDPLLPNGLTARQQATLDALGNTGKMTGQARLAAEQQYAQQNIALQQKQFSDWIQVQQLQTSQGQLSVAQQNSALEAWKIAHPEAKVTMTGGEIVTQDPRTGQEIAPRIQVTPQRADTAAMAIVSRLGPKVANGTATPDEQAQYAVAVDSYRQPVLRESKITGETLRVNTRELPAGFPEPPALGSKAPGAAGSGSNVVIPGYSPQQQEIERDPAKAKVADEQYGRDSKNVGDLTAGVTTAQNDNLRTKEMLDLLSNGDFSTGPGSETWARTAAWFQRWAPAGLTGWEKESANLRGPAAAQAFQKLAFQGVTTQEKESSPRGGILATQLFQRNNPGLDLLNPANKSLLDMKLIQNQANIDYGRGALGHFTTQETRYGDTHKYSSLEQFNTQWINQRNPQVYAAAMGAISGQPPEQWTKGLSDAEYNRALDIVSRANPSAIVNTKEGRKVMQPNAPPPPPPGFSVVR